jgi:hypothetical protein
MFAKPFFKRRVVKIENAEKHKTENDFDFYSKFKYYTFWWFLLLLLLDWIFIILQIA